MLENALWNIAAFAVTWIVMRYLRNSERTRCKCGRTLRFHFYQPHEKHGYMIAEAVLVTGFTVFAVLALDRIASVILALATLWLWRTVYFHGKGRRKWPEKAAGLVKMNRHGRLVVDNNGCGHL